MERENKIQSEVGKGPYFLINKLEHLPSVQKSKRQQPGRAPTGRQTNKKATQLRNSLLQFFDNNLFGGQKKNSQKRISLCFFKRPLI